MSARVVHLEGKRLRLTDALLIGQGGEAHVYAHPDVAAVALKVFDDPPAAATTLGALRERKIATLASMARSALPAEVVAPRAALTDKDGAFVGYAMARVNAAFEMSALARPSRTLDANAVLALFAQLGDAVARVHAMQTARCVVGDLNDGNVLVAMDPTHGPLAHLIDVDSWQVDALPCPVAHERFLDPHLYGKDLLARACFDAHTDAYALRVMLFQSLLFVHPYGGVHAPKTGTAHMTMLRRAEASWSVLRGDVQLPRCAQPIDALPDDLLHDFARAFDRGERVPFAAAALAHCHFVRCACGVEHARVTCPACKVVVQRPALTIHGDVVAETLLETRGRILVARMLDGHLCVAFEEDGAIFREDRSRVLDLPRERVACELALGVDATWVGVNGQLARVRAGTAPATDADRAHGATFACTRAGLFVLEGDSLMHHETRTRKASVIGGRTLVFGGDDAVLALYRAGRVLRGVLSRGGAHDVDLGAISGKIADVAVSFGDGRALVGIAHDDQGKRVHTLVLIDAKGRVVARASGSRDDALHLQTIRGFALAHGKIVAPTDSGVVSVDVAGATLVAGAVFADTREWVDSSVELLPGGNGSIVVVGPKSVVRLRRR